jgi:hypothetical protein
MRVVTTRPGGQSRKQHPKTPPIQLRSTAMFTNSHLTAQLARELLAQAAQRQLARQHRRLAHRTPSAGITGRLAAALARAGVVAAQAPGAIWPAWPDPLASPAGQAQAQAPVHSP